MWPFKAGRPRLTFSLRVQLSFLRGSCESELFLELHNGTYTTHPAQVRS